MLQGRRAAAARPARQGDHGEADASRTRRRTTSSGSGPTPTFVDVGSFERLRAQRAVGRLPPVLHAVPVSADADRLPRRLLPAVPEGLARGHRARRRRRAAAAQEGRDASTPSCSPGWSASRATSPRARPTPSSPRPASSPRSSRPTCASCASSSRASSGRPAKTAWTEYDDNNRGYAEPDLEAKRAFVAAAAQRVRPTLAWDLGANDGAFARLVAPHAEHVVAMDFDHETVEHMYRAARRGANILPLVVDLCDPSPGARLGPRRAHAAAQRGQPDLTLSLALIHHLSITRNIPVRARPRPGSRASAAPTSSSSRTATTRWSSGC